jgi:dCMP deaminase
VNDSHTLYSKYRRFLPIAQAFASMSKDSTQVGALILGPGFEVRSSGWNGAPRGSSADEDHRKERPEKYFWFSHAEESAIAQAARMGVAIEGCSLVVTHPPCMRCSRMIVQAGITRVFAPQPTLDLSSRWAEEMSKSSELFSECGVTLTLFALED